MDESDDNTSATGSDVEANQAVFQADDVDDAVDSDVEANRAVFQSDYIDYYVEMEDVSSDVEANQAVFQDDDADDAVDSDVEANRDIFPATYVGDDDVDSDVEANRDVFPATYVGDADAFDSDLEANQYIFPVAYVGDSDDSDEEANQDVFPDARVGDAVDSDVEANRDLFPATYVGDGAVEGEGVDYYVEMVDDDDDELARGSTDDDDDELARGSTDDDNNDVAGEVGGIIIEEIEDADADTVDAKDAGEAGDYIVEEIEDTDADEVEAENAGEVDQEPVVEGRSSATATDDGFGGVTGSLRDIFCSGHSLYPFVNKSVLWDLEPPTIEKYWSSSWRMDRAVVNLLLRIRIQMNRKMDALLFALNNSLTLWKFDKEVQRDQAAVAYGHDTPVPRYKKLFDEEPWQFTKSQRLKYDASALYILLESGTARAALKVPFSTYGWDRKKEDRLQHETFRTFGSSLPHAGHYFPPKLLCNVRKNVLLTCCEMAMRLAKKR